MGETIWNNNRKWWKQNHLKNYGENPQKMTLGEEDAFKVVGWREKLKLHGYSSSTS